MFSGNPNRKWIKLMDGFVDSKQARKDQKTVDWYTARLRHWLDFASAHRIRPERVEVEHLDRFAGHLKKSGFAYSTRQGTLTALKAFFKFLRRKRVIKVNPFDEFVPLPVEREVTEPIPLDTAYRMIRAAEAAGTPYGVRDAAIMRLLLTTGARREEVAGLELGEVDLDHGQALLSGKFDHRRRLPLRPTTISAIRLWLDYRPPTTATALFVSLHPSRAGIYQTLRPSAVNELLNRWRDAAGLPRISVSSHKWRHRFASEMKRAGDPFSLQLLLGHADISTTQRYVHSSPEELRELVLRFGPDPGGPAE